MSLPEKKIALVTGVTGQDGSYLAELLLGKGYIVHGLVRRSSGLNTDRIEHLWREGIEGREENFSIHYGDLTDANSLLRVVEKVDPDEVYHLGAQSHVRISFDIPESTANMTGLGTLRLLEVLRTIRPRVKFYQASSSEMFGLAPSPQSETTPFHPRSPYGIAKVFAHWTGVNYREAHGMFIVNGILFNHESPRRGENFVSRKITRGVARILAGKQDNILLGNLDAKRDWGYAPEYMEAAWRMMQQERADDFVIGTGETHTVREFAEEAFRLAGLAPAEKYIAFHPRHLRPTEVPLLVADAKKASRELGWAPKVRFKELVKVMLDADCKREGVELPNSV